MFKLEGFTLIEKLYTGNYSETYRCLSVADQRPVIVKLLREYPDENEIAALQHEYNLLKKLNLPGLIHAEKLIRQGNQWALILEDTVGESLKIFLAGKPLPLNTFFIIAFQLVEIIGALHQRHIIHKDIKPENIIIEPKSLQIKLTDLGISSEVLVETESIRLHALSGTLAYISPEQTGRMNRIVDYRSDFYSLGVTFFEMLTGQLPFQAKDPAELVHAHIAKIPADASDINQNVPKQIAAIINKLLSKEPEDRYASTIGLKADLLECWQQWQSHSKIFDFELGKHDVYTNLYISSKIYGRQQQIAELLKVFERVSAGHKGLFLVSGYAGIGKSSLVKEMRKVVVQRQAYFMGGKFDQLQRNVPYSALVAALRQLIKLLLAKPRGELEHIMSALQSAVGRVGGIILEVIPEMERIIGPQPPLPELNPAEANNRFNLAFQSFLQTIATVEHPLVIFLDDLQWVDSASLKFIEILLSNVDTKYLLLIGTFRDNEVDSSHPLMTTIPRLEKNNVKINSVQLQPLLLEDICQLLADTFHESVSSVTDLAQLLLEKTQGNPFFINEFLQSLYQKNLIYFSAEKERWQWNIADIKQQKITANVVDLLTDKIHKLSEQTQKVLQMAACIGDSFDLHTLALICEKDEKQIAMELREALHANLIAQQEAPYQTTVPMEIAEAPISQIKNDYVFIHDQIREAVYQLMPEAIRKETHLKVGRLLLKEKPLQENDKRLFTILEHFDYNLSLLTIPQEKLDLAQYNLWAGQKAKASSAYQAAIKYLQAGISLLPEDSWKEYYNLTFTLNKELAECTYISGNFSSAEQLLKNTLELANNAIDKNEIYIIWVNMYSTLARYEDAVKLTLSALSQLFNINLPFDPKPWDIFKEVAIIESKVAWRNIENLEFPPITDKLQNAIIKLLIQLSSAYMISQPLLMLAICKIMRITLQYGYSEASPMACTIYAVFLISRFYRYSEAFAFVKLATKIADKLKFSRDIGRMHFVYAYLINLWRYPQEVSLDLLAQSYRETLESGDLIYSSYNSSAITYTTYTLGRPLPEVVQAVENTLAFLTKINTSEFYTTNEVLKMSVQYLLNDKSVTAEMMQEAYGKFEPRENKAELSGLYVQFCKVYYILGNYDKALEIGLKGEPYLEFGGSRFIGAEGKIFFALALTKANPKKYGIKIRKLHYIIHRWANSCPANFKHYDLLLTAEVARLKGKNALALELYDQAITAAQAQNCLPIVGIANECAAQLYEKLGKNKFVKLYIQEAHYAYQRWRALRKCRLLEEKYSDFFASSERNKSIYETTTVARTTSSFTQVLDFDSILKATRAISGEAVLSKLITHILNIMLQNMGADKCILMLTRHKKLYIEGIIEADQSPKDILKSIGLEDSDQIPKTVVEYVYRTKEYLLFNDIDNLDPPYNHDPYIISVKPKAILCVSIVQHQELLGILYFENKLSKNTFTADRLETLEMLSSQAAISIENARLYRSIDRFVPKEFLKLLKRRSLVDIELGDNTKMPISILFADIKGFTTISENVTPEEIFKFINNYLFFIEPAITKHLGFIDKYLGDGIMALFPQNTDDAVQAGIAMQKAIDIYNQQVINTQEETIVRIGINSGTTMLGTIGTPYRMDGSVIGDSVNTAFRIMELNRYYDTKILIGNNTYQQLQARGQYLFRRLDKVRLRGKREGLDIWEIWSNPSTAEAYMPKLFSIYNAAFENYLSRDFTKARELLLEALELRPQDKPSKILLNRCIFFIKHGCPENWSGTVMQR